MKVIRLKTDMSTLDGWLASGALKEFDDLTAQRLVEAGYGEVVDPEEKQEPEYETRVIVGKRGKK